MGRRRGPRVRRVHRDRQLQPGGLAVRAGRHGRRLRRAGEGGEPGARALGRQERLHPGARHRRAVPLHGAARRRPGLPGHPRRADPRGRGHLGARRPLHPEPRAAPVQPRARLRAGDRRPRAGGGPGRRPRELGRLGRHAHAPGPPTARRAAGLAVREPGPLDRDAGAAVHADRAWRPRRRAVHRGRCGQRPDRREPRLQDPRPAHPPRAARPGDQRRARLGDAVRHPAAQRGGRRRRGGRRHRFRLHPGRRSGGPHRPRTGRQHPRHGRCGPIRTGSCACRRPRRSPPGRPGVRRTRGHPHAGGAAHQGPPRADRRRRLHRDAVRRRVLAP